MNGHLLYKTKAILAFLMILITAGCDVSETTSELSPETKQALDDLVNEDAYVTGYDFENYDYPAIILDYSLINNAFTSQNLDTVLQTQEDMDVIGEKVAALSFDTFIFGSEVEGTLKQMAMYEYGSTFFNENFASIGLRIRYGNIVLQNTQIDKSGYYPAIVGFVSNAGQTDYSSVYIEFNLLNEDGSIVGFTNDSIGSLASGQNWQFRCEVVEYASSYEISKLTYY